MTFIRTVLGDIAPEAAGVCYAHEHVIIDPSYVTERYPEFELASVELASRELAEFYDAGGGAMVDSMPCDCGRNALKLAEVSRRTGVHIVCPTGLHLEKYYPKGHWSERLGAEELAELFIADIETGVDDRDYGGPGIRRTQHRAGVIKVAGGKDRLSDRQVKHFTAASIAARRTGSPILTHTEEGTAALEQASLLIDGGVDPVHIVLSHTDRRPNVAYHRAILRTGVRLEYDSAFRWKGVPNHTTNLIIELASEFPDQLMLGMDAARNAYWKSYGGGPGLTFLIADYSEQLAAAGVAKALLRKIFVDNPARAYAFAD
jgi:phosphotriesterase-related protein